LTGAKPHSGKPNLSQKAATLHIEQPFLSKTVISSLGYYSFSLRTAENQPCLFMGLKSLSPILTQLQSLPQLFASEARRGRCGFGQAQIKANPDMRFYDGTIALSSVRSSCSLPLKTQVSQHSFLALETAITRCNDILSKALVASFIVLAEMVFGSLHTWNMDNARLLSIC
jgi:hypothetical protein